MIDGSGHGRDRSARGVGALRVAIVCLVMVACAAGIVAFQVTQPAAGGGKTAPFVPSPRFFRDLSPAFRTAIADAYWLALVQYYGEQVKGERDFEALPGYVRLVTGLSPYFERAYLFGAFALLDAGEGQEAYELLVRGAEQDPESWRIMTTLGMVIYTYADNPDKDALAADWYEKAARVPGAPDWVPRVAARLLEKGGDDETARLLWAQVYATGDTYAQDKALIALDGLLPREPQRRKEALDPLATVMTPQEFVELSAILMGVLESG